MAVQESLMGSVLSRFVSAPFIKPYQKFHEIVGYLNRGKAPSEQDVLQAAPVVKKGIYYLPWFIREVGKLNADGTATTIRGKDALLSRYNAVTQAFENNEASSLTTRRLEDFKLF